MAWIVLLVVILLGFIGFSVTQSWLIALAPILLILALAPFLQWYSWRRIRRRDEELLARVDARIRSHSASS
jgi:Tfp pilus assembly protein FimT